MTSICLRQMKPTEVIFWADLFWQSQFAWVVTSMMRNRDKARGLSIKGSWKQKNFLDSFWDIQKLHGQEGVGPNLVNGASKIKTSDFLDISILHKKKVIGRAWNFSVWKPPLFQVIKQSCRCKLQTFFIYLM